VGERKQGNPVRFLDSILALALFGLWAFCLIDVIMTRPATCRRLPKLAWLVIVLLLSWIGAALWLSAGRPRRTTQTDLAPAGPVVEGRPGEHGYERIGASSAGDSQAHEEYVRQLRARAEEQRARYQQSRRDDQG
jgi:hypothetical protein